MFPSDGLLCCVRGCVREAGGEARRQADTHRERERGKQGGREAPRDLRSVSRESPVAGRAKEGREGGRTREGGRKTKKSRARIEVSGYNEVVHSGGGSGMIAPLSTPPCPYLTCCCAVLLGCTVSWCSVLSSGYVFLFNCYRKRMKKCVVLRKIDELM